MKHRKFQWSSFEAMNLFTNNKTDIMKINLERKTSQFEICLKQWQHRILTLMEKLFVVTLHFQNFFFCPFISSKPTKVPNRSN